MSTNVLSAKDVNATMTSQESNSKSSIKSMEYHRQVLQSKMEEAQTKQYISPSDNIMSPCTAKLNALRNKQVGKVKPKSLFAQASAKKLEGEGLFGTKNL
ncbi:putative spo12-like protein [Phaeoacremonium minimum UCRPA7]|uniref:Putative spo12-like protein n=1 Tax=Phaeoacremonium minimum (strain UCR-PA7) TaxID=1286976 RepID=R8BHD0_PHAM7|nr:putative spo12-like protein [Phaeoacremonium minimum UCRPA7]EON98689.1 putative spo12-like protein [Phaeoacremonium minimum UCRPA7]